MSGIYHKKGRHEHTVSIRPQMRRRRKLEDRPAPFNLPHERWYRGGRIVTRDTMREKCYRAERELRCPRDGDPIEQTTFENIAECARYVRGVMETNWFQRRWPLFTSCDVIYVPGSRICRAWGAHRWQGHSQHGGIEMSVPGMQAPYGGEMIVLHELAHAVSPYREGHNRLWARTFVELVGFRMGPEMKKALTAAFRRHNIKVNPVRQVTASPEQIERLAACRPGPRKG